jgi:hypothetical protein
MESKITGALSRFLGVSRGGVSIWFLCNREKQIGKKFSGSGVSLQSLSPQPGLDLP